MTVLGAMVAEMRGGGGGRRDMRLFSVKNTRRGDAARGALLGRKSMRRGGLGEQGNRETVFATPGEKKIHLHFHDVENNGWSLGVFARFLMILW